MGLFLDSWLDSINLYLPLFWYHMVLITIALQKVLESGHMIPTLFFFLELLWQFAVPCSSEEYSYLLVNSYKEVSWDSGRVYTKSEIGLRSTAILTIWSLLIYEHGFFFTYLDIL